MDPVSKARKGVDSSEKTTKRPGGVTGKGFMPGQSGNPGGRKKKLVTEMYDEILADPKVRERIKQQIIKTMTTKGMAGVLERREAADRTEGKTPDEVRISYRDMTDEELEEKLKALKDARS